MSGVRLKICGITNAEDAREAVEVGADALGFVLAESPRRVTPEQIALICQGLPPYVTRVGVFVDEEYSEVVRLLRECRLDRAQLHGDEDPGFVRALRGRGYKAFRVGEGRDPAGEIERYPAGTVLLDTWHPDRAGGTGRPFDWSIAALLARKMPVILAGGLSPENVAAAVAQVRPWAIDISSGIESAPGRKDRTKMWELADALA